MQQIVCHVWLLIWSLQLPFWNSLLVTVFLLVLCHLSVATFISVFTFVLMFTWLLLLRYFVIVFIEVSHICIVTKFLYVCTFSMPTNFWFMPVFPESRSGTIVLDFYVKGFLIFCWIIHLQLYVRLVLFHQELVMDNFDS